MSKDIDNQVACAICWTMTPVTENGITKIAPSVNIVLCNECSAEKEQS